MRRGLKLDDSRPAFVSSRRFKPIPDEEGTETFHRTQLRPVSYCRGFKPIPDEEGTETHSIAVRP